MTADADVVMIPMRPHKVKMIGRKGSWMNWPRDERAYREKSGILQASVAQDPVTEDIQESQRYAFVLPPTLAC